MNIINICGLPIAAVLLAATISAAAGNSPSAPMSAPSGSVVVFQPPENGAPSEVGIKRDCLVVNRERISCFGLPAQMAKINRAARQWSQDNPGSSECLSHFYKVKELAEAKGWTVRQMMSSKRGHFHASALVEADKRSFLLDNSALLENVPGAWIEVTGLDLSDWTIR